MRDEMRRSELRGGPWEVERSECGGTLGFAEEGRETPVTPSPVRLIRPGGWRCGHWAVACADLCYLFYRFDYRLQNLFYY